MNKYIYILRSLPSAGKSSTVSQLIAKHYNEGMQIQGNIAICSADDYFNCGVYLYNKEYIGQAHNRCQFLYRMAIYKNISLIFVDNTNIRRKDLYYYVGRTDEPEADDSWAINVRNERNYQFRIVDLFDGGCTDEQLFERNKNTHNVPLETIKRMRQSYQFIEEGHFLHKYLYKV